MNISNLSIRQKQIFQILLNSKDYIPCKEVAAKLNVSVRTIRSDIKVIQSVTKDPKLFCTFESIPSKGYKITCTRIAQLGLSDHYFFSSNKYLEDDKRQFNIFLKILNAKKILSVSSLTQQFYISRATLYKDLHKITEDLKKYQVELLYEPYQGISILGEEKNIRFALQNKLLLNQSLIDQELHPYFGNMSFTKKNLLAFVNAFSINKISDFELSNLYCHLLTLLMRCQAGKYLSLSPESYKDFIHELEIQKVYAYFYQHKPSILTLPRDEIIYFILLLKGCNLGFCNTFALELTRDSLEQLTSMLHIDFNDPIRIANLSKYIYSMLIREYHHFTQNIALLDDVKEKSSLSFDISYRYVKILEKLLKMPIDSREVAYLAYYFLDIRESLKPYYMPNKILLVSFRGSTMCRHLLAELSSNFSFYHFEVCELYEVEQKIEDIEYSFIITDVAIHIQKDIPIILISHFLDSNDYKMIRKHLRIVLNNLVEYYFQHLRVSSFNDRSSFLKSLACSDEEYLTLMDREEAFTYQIEQAVIIYVYNHCCKTAIYYYEKGLFWHSTQVFYIFVINITERNNFLNYFKVTHIFLQKVRERLK